MRPSKKTARYLATALLVTAVAACAYAWRERANSPPHLLAEAYFEQRTLELRIPGAAHAPIRVKRGPGETTPFDRPGALGLAEHLIVDDLRGNPDDQQLLLLRGRANLLEWSYEAAITDMDRALDLQSDEAGVLDGLATAYFERAAQEQRFGDYGTAYELQSRALQKRPNDPIIIFNRAITAEKLFLFKQCFADWEHYLQLDPAGAWADEARDRYAKTKAFYDAHEARVHAPLLTPAEFAAHIDPANPQTWEQVDSRIEDYLAVAITEWLPQGYPVKTASNPTVAAATSTAINEARRALVVLASILKTNHGDVWLTDMLPAEPSAAFAEGVRALADSLHATQIEDDFERGVRQSVAAKKWFDQAASKPGNLQAAYTEAYALQFTDAELECFKKATVVRRMLPQEYRWLDIQSRIQQIMCALGSGQSKIEPVLFSAHNNAVASKYLRLQQRAIADIGIAEYESGGTQRAWDFVGQGLSSYWQSTTKVVEGYNTYAVADLIAENHQNWRLDTAIDLQALDCVSPDESPLLLANENIGLANSAARAGETSVANEHLATAYHLLDRATDTDTSKSYRLTVDLYRARLDAYAGNAQAAASQIEPMRERIDGDKNDFIIQDYYRTGSELERLAGNPRHAEEYAAAAVGFGEARRASLKSEGDRKNWAAEQHQSYRELVADRLALGDAAGALAGWELYRDAAIRRGPAIPSSPGASRREVLLQALQSSEADERELVLSSAPRQADRLLLAYSLNPAGLTIWTLGVRGLSVVTVHRNPSDLRRQAERLAKLSRTPDRSVADIRAAAAGLYSLLIEPVGDQLAGVKTLIVEPDDFLTGVPFQALVDKTGKYLAEEHSVLYSPGLRYLSSSAPDARAFSSEDSILAVGTASGGEGLRPLADAMTEAQAVASRFSTASLLLDRQASLTAVRSQLANAAIFHFAGHAGASGARMGLLLPSDSSQVPSVFDSAALDHLSALKLRLAVLSACSTEREPDERSLESEGLVKAFLRAGTPRVVASRWDVDSASSAALMATFYDALLKGNSPEQALATAEAQVRIQKPHPYYWAAFDVFGK